MARTINEIRDEIIAAKASQTGLDGLNSTSVTSIWRLLVYVVATCIWTLEKLFDLFKSDVDTIIATLKPHSLRWYAEKSKQFQLSFDLVSDADYYDNTGIAEAVVAASKIVSYAAVVEQYRGVRIKVAKAVGSDLGPLSIIELAAFSQYMKEVKDAGVKLKITSTDADLLMLELRVKYNALVLNTLGQRIDGQSMTPVKDAIKDHLKNLPFNGVFSVQKLVDAIQAVEGVSDLNLDVVQTRYGMLPFTTVDIAMIPDAGYLRILDTDLTITYLPE